MKKVYTLVLTIIISATNLQAQISGGGIPYSWQNNIDKAPDAVLLDKVQVPKTPIGEIPKNGAFAFAETVALNKNIIDDGKWINLPNGDHLCLFSFKSEGAYSLNFIFKRFLIPDGATVYVYNASKTFKLGAFTSANNKKYGSLAVGAVPGDLVIVEYFEPEDAAFSGELVIGNVGHDYLNAFGFKDGQFGASGSCNIDINCDDGNDWQNHKRSVCRLIISNSWLCSGVLVNNAAEDQTPYILSANHCVNNQLSAQNTVFYFNYESPSCKGPDGSNAQSISGAYLVATKNKGQGYLDFTLMKLSKNVPKEYKPFFAGWDSREKAPLNNTCIHHPWGDVKKISRDYDSADAVSYVGYGYDPNSFWRVNYWDRGTTEGGSSGSPLFNYAKRVVGTLSGGEASCEIDSCDYFQMFAVSYDKYAADTLQLKHWLDPQNSGIEYLDGFDTYAGDKDISDLITVAHWGDGQNLAFYLANDGGYMAGNNIYQDRAKAEFFNKIEFGGRNIITGAFVAFGYATGRNNEFIELQVIKDNMGLPSTVLGSAYASLGEIKDKADKDYVHYSFNPPVEISGSVYLSILLPQYDGDTVALMTVEESKVNTAWEQNFNNYWLPYSNPDSSWGIKLSHLIALEIGNYTDIKEKTGNTQQVDIFPNPAANNITIRFNKGASKPYDITILDMYGRTVRRNAADTYSDEITMDISQLPSGFYVVMLKNNEAYISKKFIKD